MKKINYAMIRRALEMSKPAPKQDREMLAWRWVIACLCEEFAKNDASFDSEAFKDDCGVPYP